MILYTICWSHFLHLSSIINLVVSCFSLCSCDSRQFRFKVGTKRLLPRPLCECNEMWATSCVIFGVSWNQKGWPYGKLLFCYSNSSKQTKSPGQFECDIKFTNWNWMTVGKHTFIIVCIMKYEEAKTNYKLIYNWTSQNQDVQEPTAILTKPSTVLPTPTDSFRHSRAFFANWLEIKASPKIPSLELTYYVAPCLLGFPKNDQFLEDLELLEI